MQNNALIGTRNVFLQACPGSGKTTAVAGRVAWLRAMGAKVALLSFTNIGAQEIASKVQSAHGITISGDSYSGTLHSFLQRYVLTPFAHMLTGSNVAVRIDPRSVELLDPEGLNSQDYTFAASGSVVFNNPAKGSPPQSDAILSVKLAAAKAGVVSTNDALYWSARVLAEVPGAAAALAKRFDEIIVDEAQDTSELQLLAIGWLRASGLKSLVLVGDYDQSIYGFNGARKDLCQREAENWGLLPKELTENYRSSQAICDVVGRLRGDGPPDKAVGKDKDFGVPPQVFFYTPGKEKEIPETFRALMSSKGVEAEDSAVLASSNRMCSLIRAQSIDVLPRDLMTIFHAKMADGGTTLAAYQAVEQLLRRLAFGSSATESGLDPLEIRNVTVQLLFDIPQADLALNEWAKHSIQDVDAAVAKLTSSPGSTLEEELRDELLELVLDGSAVPNTDIRISTIHGVKGESIDAVTLTINPQSERQQLYGYPGPAGDLAARLANPSSSDLDTDEWRRGSYVAMTRARRLLAVAIPDSDDPSPLHHFLNAGFELFDFSRAPKQD